MNTNKAQIASNTPQLNSNTSQLNTHAVSIGNMNDSIISHSQQISQLTQNQKFIEIYNIPLTLYDMLNVVSIPNASSINLNHNFNIGKALYDNYGMISDFFDDGRYKTSKTVFELCFTGKFTSNNSEVYNLQTGFRNIHKNSNQEHSTTQHIIDCGYETTQNSASSFHESIRYNSGMVYIMASSPDLYKNYFLYLHTKLHAQTPLTGTVNLIGHITVKCY